MPVSTHAASYEAKIIVQNAEIRCYRLTIVCSTITRYYGVGFSSQIASELIVGQQETDNSFR